MKLSETLRRADITRRQVWEAVVGPIVVVDNRTQTLMAYMAIALEHQEAIVVLTRNGLRGSALALVRPVFEILYRTGWMSACATSKDVDKIVKGKFKFPHMDAMVSAIDKARGDDYFLSFKKLSWNDQNDFMHTVSHRTRNADP